MDKNYEKLDKRSDHHPGDESDKHLEAQDRRYSCLTFHQLHTNTSQKLKYAFTLGSGVITFLHFTF